jgi:hypothetical protein
METGTKWIMEFDLSLADTAMIWFSHEEPLTFATFDILFKKFNKLFHWSMPDKELKRQSYAMEWEESGMSISFVSFHLNPSCS